MTIPVILVIVPLIVSAFIALLLRERGTPIKYISLAASLISSLMIAYIIFTNVSGGAVQSYPWFNAGFINFQISVATMPLNLLLLGILAVITPLIFLYSTGFMQLPSEQSRFYFEMCVFAAAMMLFAISANFITMFIAWEMLGITSYLLIGFWYWKEKVPGAARKAITTIIIGDILMLIAILLIGVSYNSFEFSTVLASSTVSPALYVSLVLILIAVFTKSAQFPFHEWLSDAMEGPTPVSGFLHSSTMVKAGVFLIAVLLPLYVKAGLLSVILVFGIISAALGASNALTERHVKKILAYSTIEDIGLMFIALGFGSVIAAMMLFLVQAFYKALLFMSAGTMMRANDEREDIYTINGMSTSKTFLIITLIGALSLAGIFPLSGFFGKGYVESSISNPLVYAIVLLIELATSIYIFRWVFLQSRRPYEQGNTIAMELKATPKSMLAAAAILAALVVIGSAAYIYLPGFLGSTQTAQIGIEQYITVNIIALLGLAVAYRVYRQGHRLHMASTNRALFSLLYNSPAVNKAYLYIAKGVSAIGSGLGRFDLGFDKVTYSAAGFTIGSGDSIKKVVDGQTNVYVFAFIVGVILLVFAYVIYL